jgi:hypothetical protein
MKEHLKVAKILTEKPKPKWCSDSDQIAYFIENPIGYNTMRFIDECELVSFYDALCALDDLTEEQKIEVDRLIASKKAERDAIINIARQAPYLLDGTLPPEYMERLTTLDGRTSERYAILVNQSGQFTIEEALDYLKTNKGVVVEAEHGMGYGILHRFVATPSHYLRKTDGSEEVSMDYLKKSINEGYYGVYIGRYVVFAPLAKDIEAHSQLGEDWAYEPAIISEKIIGNPPIKKMVVGAKFVYCFIDADGNVWVNSNYLKNDEPNFIKP